MKLLHLYMVIVLMTLAGVSHGRKIDIAEGTMPNVTKVLLDRYNPGSLNVAHNEDASHVDIFFNEEMIKQDSLRWLHSVHKGDVASRDIGLALNAALGNYEQIANEEVATSFSMKAGLEWNIIGDGLLENKREKQEQYLQSSIDKLEAEWKYNEENYGFRYHRILAFFNHDKIQLLTDYTAMLNQVIRLYNTASMSHILSFDKMMDYKNRLNRYAALLKSLENYNNNGVYHAMAIEKVSIPVYDVDINRLISENGYDVLADSIAEMRVEQSRMRNKQSKDWKLKLYGSYNVRKGSTSKDYVNYGVSLKVPLTFQGKKEQRLAQLEEEIIQRDNEVMKLNIKKELLGYYYEYGHKLKQYVQFKEQQHELDNMYRMHEILMSYPEANINSMNLIHLRVQQYENRVELATLKAQLYLLLLKVHRYACRVEFASYLTPYEGQKAKNTEKYLRITSQDVDLYGIKWIMFFLIRNGVDYVLWEGESVEAEMLTEAGLKLITRNGDSHEDSYRLIENNGQRQYEIINAGEKRLLVVGENQDGMMLVDNLQSWLNERKEQLELKLF
ncbi:hypothetical protein EYV94_16080 [Puteibacter caeruleilacunae]|nr:hypothetical protein EYV94_16080 [Puteibacter caeruleilacunae]